jgi:hypothetical protein
MKCARCKKEVSVHTMSRFNTDNCCIDCIEREKKHPKYQEALRAENAAVKMGDYNFPGIGCPPELYHLPAAKTIARFPLSNL